MHINCRLITARIIWDGFVQAYDQAGVYYTWDWGEHYAQLGYGLYRYGIYAGDRLVGLMYAITQDYVARPYVLVPRTPLVEPGYGGAIEVCVQEIKKLARQKKCGVIRFCAPCTSEFDAVLKKQGMILNEATIVRTVMVDLLKPAEEILGSMRATCRHQIQKSQSQGIVVLGSSDYSGVEGFYGRYLQAAGRKGFAPHSLRDIAAQFQTLAVKGNATLYSAILHGQLLAQAIVLLGDHEAVYKFGISTAVGHRYPGAHAVQWAAMLESKRRGLARYDMGGIAPTDDPGHPLAGVTLFKRGFGGSVGNKSATYYTQEVQ